MATMKKPTISRTASSMNSEELVKETSQPNDLDGDDAVDLELMDGVGHSACPGPRFGAATPIPCQPSQSSSSGTLWPMRPPVRAVKSLCIRS